MNNNEEGLWSSGLSRSYSEHAAVLLQHFQQQRLYPEPVKYSRSTSGLHNNDQTLELSQQDYRNETGNFGYLSCHNQLSTSLSEDAKQLYNQSHKLTDVGCGDSSALTSELSELSLTDRQALNGLDGYEDAIGFKSASLPSTSQNTRKTSYVAARNSLLNDNGDNYNNSSEYQLSDEPKSGQDDCSNSEAVQTYSSSSSLGTTSRRQRLSNLSRNISYEKWVREKQRELQRRKNEARHAEMERNEAEERKRREQEAKQHQDYTCFLDWVKRKKHEKLLKQKLTQKELELERQLHDIEQKTQLVKNMGLMQWRKNKEKQLKASEKEVQMKQKKTEEEKEKRLQESVKAYEKWQEKAKNKPRPATQGLLPHHKVKPTFTNPTPWKSLLDSGSDDSDSATQSKEPIKAVQNQRSKRTCVKR